MLRISQMKVKKIQNKMEKNVLFSNSTIGTHCGSGTYAAAEKISSRHLLLKLLDGDGYPKVAVAEPGDRPFGVSDDEAAPSDFLAVRFLQSGETVKMVAASPITAGEFVYLTEGGKVQLLPSAPGSYSRVGLALTSALTDQLVEVTSCLPIEISPSE